MDFVLNKIDKHLGNHMSFDQYREDLKRKLKELNGLKEDIESTMSIELRPRKKLKTEVQIWLKNVERINAMEFVQPMEDLKRKLNELNDLKKDIESTMSIELRPGKKLKTEVQIWLEKVERINGEVQDLDAKIGESNGLTRGFHSEGVLRLTREVEELIQHDH